MAKYTIKDTTLTNIANAIRDETIKSGYTPMDYTPEDMPVGIGEVSTLRREQGFEEGKKSQYDEFWDCLLAGGKKIFNYAFRNADWSKTSRGFDPPRAIKPTDAVETFAGVRGITRLTKEQIDYSVCNVINYGFAWAVDLIEIEEVYLTPNHVYAFAECYKLEKIGKLIISENVTRIVSEHPFASDSKLTHITIEGVIPSTISFQWCSLLTHESLMSIINALKDLVGTEKTATITLHANAKGRLTDAEKAIITQKGWTLA